MKGKIKQKLKALGVQLSAVVQIGKEGMSDTLIDSTREALQARELIKVHVLPNAVLDTKETIEALADMLGAEVIQVIGRYGILFKKKKEKSHFEDIL
ncbi:MULTISPECIES: YhbY family RNA-binding protein [Megasphaera]|uniref:RNA-binding protein n=1 Tax=Megasphaera hutchinsoni TaxID=1588748 RepID=A0A134CKF3_9FIRM|nr:MULTISPECIES: YhbY family RNA-binding protein [Megasphaera]MUP47700.1 ribosome assembly RNA-binding protein YhbY [Veillonellaceae bacterium M2-8]MUP59082.1 ribosome assembly RNA-binding protein YhbY [Veillonellaceae bacterium M2-4]EGS33915.1 RNA-binding protein, YhbY family [Megasphaera sp. UPII 135-E]KXB92691.1 RNA-binding protein, YhbY family [Megasphaera hutchinsoni]PNH22262.1 RNA-binding protein [Megasphaera genomosp. type_2]